MRADVLTILDCCYAGNAQKGCQDSHRMYDLLAACPAGKTTPAAGKASFSRRLIDILDDMLNRNPGQRLLTTRLLAAINKDRRIPAMLHDRLHKDSNDQRHVQLVRIDGESKSKTKEDARVFNEMPKEKARVTLQFSLSEEEMSENTIETWAQQLIESCNSSSVPLRRIDWLKMEKNLPGERFSTVVDAVNPRRKKLSRGRQRFQRVISTIIQKNSRRLANSRKRSRSRDPPSSPPKRQASSNLLTTDVSSKSRPMTPESTTGL
jgi:hypothetical protein